MKKILIITALLGTIQSHGATSTLTYDFEGDFWVGNGNNFITEPCKSRYSDNCWKNQVTFAEPSDLEALEKKINDSLKTEFIKAQSVSTKALLQSDELKRVIKRILIEELRNARESQ